MKMYNNNTGNITPFVYKYLKSTTKSEKKNVTIT